ncbi:hypothetical protein [Vibrio sp. 10N.222.55.B11]|jgi:hypothetical protein|uniref:Uncharacterized protein n=1 Tax=Vibrio splendidus TaxID=29497 RepID=A0A0H3ZSS6_VIBSP|nr:hypothetical protein [Vibrio splendidus]OEE08857.1 hypothetical protein OC5_06170 [Vibrio cyclitrophicus ZF264]PMJ38689.1 hypothetical protein BCU24_19970 [Vibrio cyclitrophicus]PMH04441.1 hypothetical protein BCU75_23165 [Vibrio splendidus]PMI77082.1 hypothetical protein BCU37_22240 [Vibrio splendidus]
MLSAVKPTGIESINVAPAFPDDFVAAADMDTEINIYLLEAEGLHKILSAFKQRRNPQFFT